jgi:hypothetical protein
MDPDGFQAEQKWEVAVRRQRVLVQTTIPAIADDWNVSRFSRLAAVLERAGHDVTARDRDPGADPVLGRIDQSDYDQLWLLAVDTGGGLRPDEAAAIERFRRRGGGVMTARDHQDLGSCVLGLGSLGRVNNFHSSNAEPDASRDDPYTETISWPNYHSGANGDYQAIQPAGDVPHPLLTTARTSSGVIEWFPAHPHEGAVTAPLDLAAASAVATGCSRVTGRRFNLAVALDGDTTVDGEPLGRALACSTFHHFADMNWEVGAGAPSFVSEAFGTEIADDPERLDIFHDYVRNIADWLRP